MLLSQALALWVTGQRREIATVKRYRGSISRLERLGFRSVADVTRERVGEAQGLLLERGWALDSVRSEMIALRSVLAPLDDLPGVLAPGQLAGVRKAALRRFLGERRRRVRFLSRLEYESLAEGAARIMPRFELPLRVAVLAGPRVGELARLRAEDARGGSLSIEYMPEWGELGACKTGPRVVPVCRELRELLDARLPRTGWLFPAQGAPRSDQISRPFMSRSILERGLRHLRRRLSMPDDITWTVLRHTRASWWLQGGASIYKTADWMGHSVTTCERFYGSLVDGYDPDCERMPA